MVAVVRSDGVRRVLAVGEVTHGRRMGLRDLHRLERVRELLQRRTDVDASDTRLLCFSAAGFDEELRGATGVELVDLERLYGGE